MLLVVLNACVTLTNDAPRLSRISTIRAGDVGQRRILLSVELEPLVDHCDCVGFTVPMPDELRAWLERSVGRHLQIAVAVELFRESVEVAQSLRRQATEHLLLDAPCNAADELA